jgi:cyclopropane fatty-acyl-phospholipid synthase-like methyltransferase
MIVLMELLLIIFLLYLIGILSYSMIRGAPYAPIGEEKTKAMLTLLKIKAGEKAVDLGAGDGRIVIKLALGGAEAHGYEINPILVMLAKHKIRKEGLQGKAFIHWTDFWKKDLSSFDIVTVYLTSHIMKAIEKKLQKELKRGARVTVNYFAFPSWKPEKQKDTIYLYLK